MLAISREDRRINTNGKQHFPAPAAVGQELYATKVLLQLQAGRTFNRAM